MNKTTSRNILIVTKARVPAAAELGIRISRWLRERGNEVQSVVSGQASPLYDALSLDLIIVLGGDGTILGAARCVLGRKVPLVCINFGRVGFLADIEPENWEQGLEEVLSSDTYRSSTGLSWRLERYGHLVAHGSAVNDVVLSRAALARLVCADIFINGEPMGSVRADGFLLSTPLGSSGYSVSAGGPLFSPDVSSIAFVPICAFLNTLPSIVFPVETEFRFVLMPGTTESYLTVDGQEGQLMQTNDVLVVEGIPDAVRFLGRGISFIERLRTRSFILQNPIRNRENKAF